MYKTKIFIFEAFTTYQTTCVYKKIEQMWLTLYRLRRIIIVKW